MSKKVVNIVYLGPGKVGTAFLRQLSEKKRQIEQDYNLEIRFVGVINSQGAVFNKKGLNLKEIVYKYLKNPKKYFLKDNLKILNQKVTKLKGKNICIDTSASERTIDFIYKFLKNEGYVVMSNKIPLSSGIEDFNKLFKYKDRLFFETTVGAGLPVISTIKELIETGDVITKIEGSFSGTLSYIFSSLDKGFSFSKAVNQAFKKGYTEPDPRDDLSGKDFARKVLILSRLLGKAIEINDIHIDKLYPDSFERLSVDEFLKKLTQLDKKFNKKIFEGKKSGYVLRYSAVLGKKKRAIKLSLCLKNSDLGSLQMSDNIFIITSVRYRNNSIVIKGPGAGPEVTAAGVFGDFLKALRTNL
jgi:aspartokinase/homoserine dehydrogenase 1